MLFCGSLILILKGGETKKDPKCTCLNPMAYSSSRASQIKYVVFVGLLLISNLKGVEVKAMSDNASPISNLKSVGVKTMSDNTSLYLGEPFTRPSPQIKYDVFVSFRGTDIRQGFLSHLMKALSQKQIFAFVDDKLERGDEISQALLGTIERSLISLIIFSENYASSRWCLEELVKIVECRKKDGKNVIPVFYKVDPSDVRHQKGTYRIAFVKHEKKYSEIRVQNWRSALKDSANLSGFHSSNFRNEAELVEEIVKCVLMRLNDMHQVKAKGLIGIDKPIAHLESLLCQEPEDVRVIGIWGMSGIGKTTIAEEVFNKLCSQYESCYFLANVREESRRYGIISLKRRLFSTLLEEEDLKIDTPNGLPSYVERRLGRIKVLIVLDDVNDSNQLETLIGAHDSFGSGSRIIVTTRDKQVLAKEADDIYEVGALNCDDSLELFILNAFKQDDFDMEYCQLSKRVVDYAKGIPLVLKVLSHLLRGKDKEIWESQLEKLKRMPDKKIHDVMRLSYDDLDREEQKILLDIACFFDGLNLKVDYIRILLKDHDYSVAAGLERLKDKALITISQNNIVSTHDLIREMAWEIVRKESIEVDLRNQLRLWDSDDIYQVLKNNKGSEFIRSIFFDFSVIKELELSPQVFDKMSRLKFLNFYSNEYHEGLYLPQGLVSLPNELRYLSWTHYPLESLPTNFSMEKLVILNLPHNRVKKLWHGMQILENLKVVNLYNSSDLIVLPDFRKAPNLKVIDLSWCSLACVHRSIFSLDKLEILILNWCFGLVCLPRNVHLSSLRYLYLTGCVRLKEFSVTSESMKILSLELTGIKQLPSSFGRQSKLEILLLRYSDIESLPATIKNLTRLRYLDVSFCWHLQTLPELPPSLEKLDASGCISLETILFPLRAAQQLNENRKVLLFWNCLNLDEYSLWAIGLNARINLMKSAYQHLSTLGIGGDYDARTIYVYPESRVPEWLVYRTTHDDVTIDLSSAAAPHSSSLAFIFCFIVPKVPSKGLGLIFSISVVGEGEGEGEGNCCKLFLVQPRQEIISDHVFLIYDQELTRCLNSISRVKIQPRFKIKVTVVSQIGKSEYVPVILKGFGVSPINASEYHNFIQQMELSYSNPKCQISHLHLTISAGALAMNQKNWHERPSYDDPDVCWKLGTNFFISTSIPAAWLERPSYEDADGYWKFTTDIFKASRFI